MKKDSVMSASSISSNETVSCDTTHIRVQNYIFGQFEDTETYIDSFEPATGKIWAHVPNSNEDVTNRAVVAANNAFGAWSDMPEEQRSSYLMKTADILEQRLEEFALAESRDQGKPIGLATTMDIPRSLLNLRAFAEGQKYHVESCKFMKKADVINYTQRESVGVAGLITPWNLPLYLLTFKLSPALMSGNTVVIKPSEMTSVTAWMLCKIFHEVGLPKGVVNLVCGYGKTCGEALVKHPDVRVISFTGSTQIGARIAGIAAPMMKKLSLELGGKNPAIVFEDANLKEAIPTLIRGAFANQGEICLSTSRIFVHSSIYKEFLDKYVEVARNLSIGRGKKVFVGALVSKQHLEKVKHYVHLAIDEGGHVHCGETVNDLFLEDENTGDPSSLSDGYFMRPTVITGLKDSSRCMQEEIFGPVVCISEFSGLDDEIIQRANNIKYGLCASVWSENAARLARVAAKLQVGTVWQNCWLIRELNMPFGGTKQSGIGREGINHSIETFTELKTICLKK